MEDRQFVFGPFRLDPVSQQLWRGEELVALRPKLFAVLRRLLEHAGPILLRLDAARAEVARMAAPPPAQLVFGLAPLAMTELAASALASIRPSHPRLAVTLQVIGREALASRAALRLEDLADARWLDAPDTGMPLADLRAATGSDGFRAAFRYEGTDVRTLLALAAAEHGLTVLPRPVVDAAPGVTGIPLSWPPLVHRTEIIRGASGGVAAAAIAAAITLA